MHKIIKLIQSAFLIYDDYKDNGQRISESMVFSVVMLLGSALVLFGVIPTGFAEQDAMAIGTGLYALGNMILRLRSKGGKIKLVDSGSHKDIKEHPPFNGFTRKDSFWKE
jgi:hypothetical protein